MANKFFKECLLQDIYHYEALEVWGELEIGKELSLDKDEDKKVVLIYGEKRIGRLSDDDAKFIYDFIEAGYKDVFVGIVSLKSGETADESKRLKVVIKIRENENKAKEVKVVEINVVKIKATEDKATEDKTVEKMHNKTEKNEAPNNE